MFDEYDADGNYVGGDESPGPTFVYDTLGSRNAVLFKVPGDTVVTTPGGTIYYTTLAAVLLQATFTSFDQPIAYEVRADRLGAIPEPGTWSLMIAGFGLAGAALRARRATRSGPSLPPPATRLTS